MRIRRDRTGLWRRAAIFAGVGGMVCAAALLAAGAAPDQPAGDSVGVIEGADIAITGPMSVEVVGGQVKTILRSGSDVLVKSGRARISLVEGGQVAICGPAHLSVLKSGGTLTLALESGVVHARVGQTPALTIYTPQIQGQTVAVGDDPRDLTVGIESPGALCIRTSRGALRIEQQLTGQSVMVPQGGDIVLTNGQIESLRNGAGRCNCDLEIAKAPTKPPRIMSEAATSQPSEKNEATQSARVPSPSNDPATQKDEPLYQVYLPPLRYDATAKVQPEPDPQLMMIVRRVRVRPTLIFEGKVEGEPVTQAAVASPPPLQAAKPAIPAAPSPAQSGVMERMRSFFQKLFSHGT